MPYDPHVISYSILSNAPGIAGTSATVKVGDGAMFAAGANATVRFRGFSLPLEIVRVTAVVGDILTITRAQEGTTALNLDVGWEIFQSVTAKSFTDIETTLTAAQATLAATNAALATAQATLAATTAAQVAATAILAGTTATPASFKIHGPSPWRDVTDSTYGADPTGTTDSTAAIQAAISSGTFTFLPPGTYSITSSLVFTGYNFHFAGSLGVGGQRATILRWDGAPGGTVIQAQNCRDSIFEMFSLANGANNFGIGIDIEQGGAGGNGTKNVEWRWISILTASGATGVALGIASSANCERQTFTHLTVTGTGTYGVQIGNRQSYTTTFQDCSFTGQQYGIDTNGQIGCYSVEFILCSISAVRMSSPRWAGFYNCTEQTCPAFLTSGVGSAQAFVVIENISATPDVVIGTFLQLNFGGSIICTGCDFSGGVYNAAWRVEGRVIFIGCNLPNSVIISQSGQKASYKLWGCTAEISNNSGGSFFLPDVSGSNVTNAGSNYPPGNMDYGGLIGLTNRTGLLLRGGGLFVNKIAAPTGVTVVPTGADNGVTYSYYVVAIDTAGNKSVASATVSTTHGPTTLSVSNYITVSWNLTPGYVAHDVIRSVGGVAQGSIALAFDTWTIRDTGLTASAYVPVTRSASADSSFQGLIQTAASDAGSAGINLPAGVAPTTPLDGDLFYDGVNLKFRIGGVTKTVTLT